MLVSHQVHLVGVYGAIDWHAAGDGQVSQAGTAQHLGHTQHHPTRPAQYYTRPPADAVLPSFFRHEAQVVDLLAHLRNQSNAYRERSTKQVQIEHAAHTKLTTVVHDAVKRCRIAHQNKDKWHDQHQQPKRLRPHLQMADG